MSVEHIELKKTDEDDAHRVAYLEIESNDNQIELNQDVFTLFFLIIYNNQMRFISKRKQMLCWFGITIIYLVQLFCLIVLSIAYAQQFISAAAESDKSYKMTSKLIMNEAPLHFVCTIAALFVLFGYLLQSITSWVDLYCACLNCNKCGDLYLYYGTTISILNITLALSTWVISIFVILFSLYNQTGNPAEVVLASVSNVFILEIDDYIGSFFKRHCKCEWKVEVKLKKHQKASSYLSGCIVIALIVQLCVLFLGAGDFFDNMGTGGWASGDLKYIIDLFIYIGIMVPFLGMGIPIIIVTLSIKNEKIKKIFITIGWITCCIGSIGWPAVIHHSSIVQPHHMITMLLLVISCILFACVGYVICYKNNKMIYFGWGYEYKLDNVLFIIIQVVTFAVSVMWRSYGAEKSEVVYSWFVIIVGIFYKCYAEDIISLSQLT